MDYERIAELLIMVAIIAVSTYVIMDFVAKYMLIKVAEGKL